MSVVSRVSDPGTHWEVADPARLAALIRLRAVRMVAPQGFGYLGQVSAYGQDGSLVAARVGKKSYGCPRRRLGRRL
jgi:hypothetical protein